LTRKNARTWRIGPGTGLFPDTKPGQKTDFWRDLAGIRQYTHGKPMTTISV